MSIEEKTKMDGSAVLLTTDSYKISGREGFFGGGTIIPELPAQYCPTRTLARYIKRPPLPPPAYLTE